MTNRNRRPQRRARPARTARMVWVNEHVDLVLLNNSVQVINVLTLAEEFMLFDTTIVSVIIPVLQVMGEALTDDGIREVRVALEVGKNTLDSDDFNQLLQDSVGPSWLWIAGDAQFTTVLNEKIKLDLLGNAGVARVKAMRRFRENDSTLFLIVQNFSPSGSEEGLILRGMIRTLLRIP